MDSLGGQPIKSSNINSLDKFQHKGLVVATTIHNKDGLEKDDGSNGMDNFTNKLASKAPGNAWPSEEQCETNDRASDTIILQNNLPMC